jgi:hypothetical protein
MTKMRGNAQQAHRATARRRRFLLAGLLYAASILVFLPTHAAAQQPPSLSWTVPHGVSEGAPIAFSWTGKHLGRKHRLVVQRPVGTAHTWQTVVRLRGNHGSGELPGLALGKYRLRIADLVGRRVLAQQVVGIGVYGTVPFSILLKNVGSIGVYTTPRNSFPYVARADEPGETPHPVFTVAHNHCLSAHIAFVPGYPNALKDETETVTGFVSVVQESREAVSASAPFDDIGSLDAELVPGQTWSLTAYFTGEFSPHIYINGYAVCNSKEPFS